MNHPAADCIIVVDGHELPAVSGQSLTAALHRHGRRVLRANLVTGEPRAPFCGMGVCFECEVRVDGVPGRRACLVHVHDGLQVETEQPGAVPTARGTSAAGATGTAGPTGADHPPHEDPA